MRSPRLDKTMDQIFEEFLAEPATCDLYQSWLKHSWPDHWRREYGSMSRSRDGTFFGPPKPEENLGGFSGFPAREVGTDSEMMGAAGAVLQIVGIWLATNGHRKRDNLAGEPISKAARNFRTDQDLLRLFRARLAEDNSDGEDDDIPF